MISFLVKFKNVIVVLVVVFVFGIGVLFAFVAFGLAATGSGDGDDVLDLVMYNPSVDALVFIEEIFKEEVGEGKPAAPMWAESSGTDEWGRWASCVVQGVACRLRYVPAGTFMMGEGSAQSQVAVHQVTLSRGYWLAETETTQSFYQAVTGENPSHFVGSQLPVDSVSHEDAQKFLKALQNRIEGATVRLPTEAEWEYACRASTDPGQLIPGWNSSNNAKTTQVVAALAPNAWGFYDMLGNVMEWVGDAYTPLDTRPATDPFFEQGLFRLAKGGAWSVPAEHCHPALRSKYQPQT